MRRISIFIVMVLSFLIVAAPLHSQEDEQAPRLYFQSDTTLYWIDPSSDPPTMETLATLPSTIQCSKWANGGEWLIISTMEGIYRLNHDTLELETLVEETQFGEDVQIIADCPLVSPDGEWIGFRTRTLQMGAAGVLHSIRVDGSDLQTVIPEFTFGADWRGLVQWSYDSEWMIVAVGIGDEWGYWHIRPDGSGLELIESGVHGEPHFAAYSADGESIVYWYSDNSTRELWVDDEVIHVFDESDIEYFAPVWTPDSEWILVMMMDWRGAGDSAMGRLATLRLSRDGSEQKTLFEIPYDLGIFTGILAPSPPVWSPDREWAVIVQANELIEITTGTQVELPNAQTFSERGYVWEADSQGLWYMALEDDEQSLMRFDMAAQASTFIIDLPDVESWNQLIAWWDQP